MWVALLYHMSVFTFCFLYLSIGYVVGKILDKLKAMYFPEVFLELFQFFCLKFVFEVWNDRVFLQFFNVGWEMLNDNWSLFLEMEVCFHLKQFWIPKNKILRTVLKTSSQLLLGIKFCLGTEIWKTIFFALFFVKGLYTHVQYENSLPILCVFLIVFLEHFTKMSENTSNLSAKISCFQSKFTENYFQ